MTLPRAVALLLVVLVTGCASGRVVRLETGRGSAVVFTPRADDVEPVELGRAEFQEAVSRLARDMRAPANPQGAARQLFEVDARSGSYLFNPRTQRVTPQDASALLPDAPTAEVELTRAYLRWCERTGRKGDCLRLLTESPTVNGDGRYALAMALAQGVVWEEMLASFKDMADPQAVLSAVLWTGTMYLMRYTVPGRELIDTLDAVRRHDFAARELPGHGLKAVARHLGLAGPQREYIPGAQVHDVFRREPARVRRYASDDVQEAAGVARVLGGAAFALARMAPRRYERLADAGPATGVLDPLLVRAYLRAGAALPAHAAGDGTAHSGAALHLFATGVARRVVKADVASLYPSLMREYRIGPAGDRLGVLLALVDRLVEQRLAAKARGRAAAPGSPERHTQEALSAAMKIVVNSAYGYLGAVGLTRFADVHAANEVTRRGREVLGLLCRELARRGVTLLEADTDGVYFSVPEAWSEADERRVVSEVAALLPPRVQLEFDGRYAAMLSHEPKNYALQPYDGPLVLRGVAFRSSRAEPFGEDFLRRALRCLLAGDIPGVREAYVATVVALRRREVSTFEVAAHVRLTKSPEQYLATRERRRELPYEAMLEGGRTRWVPGARVHVYRAVGGRAGLLPEVDEEDDASPPDDPRDYDVEYYVRLLRETFAARLVRALTPEDFATVFADPAQPSLFAPLLTNARPVLKVLMDAEGAVPPPRRLL